MTRDAPPPPTYAGGEMVEVGREVKVARDVDSGDEGTETGVCANARRNEKKGRAAEEDGE